MRVLHVAQPVDGGVAGYAVAACLDQLARGWEVAVACPDGGWLPARLAELGVPRLPWAAVRTPGPSSVDEARRLRRLVRGYRPDVVHLHAAKAGLAGRLRRCRGVPVVFQPHGWSWLAATGPVRAASLAWERAAARWTDLTVCVAAQEAEVGRAAGVRGRYAVIRNGVDLNRYRPAGDAARARARRRLDVAPDVPLAVCVGRVTRQKGQDVLLAAWPRVRAHCPAALLVLVGDGAGLAGNGAGIGAGIAAGITAGDVPGVRLAGAVPDVRDWLAAADVVVLPSRWEGLPLAALEALATGRGLVATDIPGLAEVVTPAVGALVPPDHPGALAEQVARRLADPGLARAEGIAAARHAAAFDIRHTFHRLAAATEALARPPRSTGNVPGGERTRAAWQR
jgi:glycosyltransferase involved in cell wall biosynthesis